MPKRIIKTRLIDREEVFRFLAVAEATKLAALLKGPAGVGKTRALLDYGKAVYGGSMNQMLEETFLLETDESTRGGDVKGRPDMKLLLTEQKYVLNSPIVKAKYILINEIDKASGTLRNAFLSIMNEGFLFNGESKVPCEWKLFLASCNVIPEDEKGSPFWDRFVLKMEVSRIGKQGMATFFADQIQQSPEHEIEINVPSRDEMRAVQFNPDHLTKFIEVCHDHLSDRTLGYVPKIASAVALVYNLSPARALVKTAALLTNQTTAKKLGQDLEPKEVIDIRSKIELIGSLSDRTMLQTTLTDIQAKVSAAAAKDLIDESMVAEFKADINAGLVKSGMVAYVGTDTQKDLAKAMQTS